MLKKILDYYNDVLARSDPRVQKLFLMETPKQVVVVCFIYLVLIYILAPLYMQKKDPYNLKRIITIYNILQVASSAYIFSECLAVGWFTKYDIFRCHSVDFTTNANSVRELWITYIYFLSKFTEFLDTIFFVLRKKYNQITFLHVYHHVSMPLYSWSVTKFYPGGSTLIVAMLNSGVHVIMYIYYLLSGLGPKIRKYLWWKKYLTRLQMIQFITGTLHLALIIFSDSNCNISKVFAGIYIILGVIFYALFSHFYNHSYKAMDLKKSFRKICDNDLQISENINNNIKTE